jgi:hypothetical protein
MSPTLVPKDAGAFSAFAKAVELACGKVDAAARFRQLINSGTPLFKIDNIIAGACETVVVYKPTDALLGYLAAFETGDGETDTPSEALGHGLSLSLRS